MDRLDELLRSPFVLPKRQRLERLRLLRARWKAQHNARRREFIACKTKATARRHCPWAEMIGAAPGGFMAFEDLADYVAWRKEKAARKKGN